MRVHAFSGNKSLVRGAYDNWKSRPVGQFLYALRGLDAEGVFNFGKAEWDEFLSENNMPMDSDFYTTNMVPGGDVWFPDGVVLYVSDAQPYFDDWSSDNFDPSIRPPEITVTPSYTPPAPSQPVYEEEFSDFDEDEWFYQQSQPAPSPAPAQQTSYPSPAPAQQPAAIVPASYTPPASAPAAQPGKKTDWMPIIMIGGGLAVAFMLFGKKKSRGRK